MKLNININDLKNRITFYFKERFDQAVVLVILSVTIINALFISIVFYLAVLSPFNLDFGSKDYKYIRIKVNNEVLEKLKVRDEIDQETLAEIESVKDPFN